MKKIIKPIEIKVVFDPNTRDPKLAPITSFETLQAELVAEFGRAMIELRKQVS